MTSPRALLFSLAATVCGFIFAIVVVTDQASSTPTSPVDVVMAPSHVSVVAQDVSDLNAVPFTVALEPAASHFQLQAR